MKAARTTNRTNTSHIVRQIVESEDSDISVTDYVRTAFSDNFGHSNCVILREFVQTALFAVLPLTRSLTHVYGGIAQNHEILKSGSNLVRVAVASSPIGKARLRNVCICLSPLYPRATLCFSAVAAASIFPLVPYLCFVGS